MNTVPNIFAHRFKAIYHDIVKSQFYDGLLSSLNIALTAGEFHSFLCTVLCFFHFRFDS